MVMPMRSRGFTLIELLAVLAIVAVLLTLAMPRHVDRIDMAKEVVLRDNLRSTREVIDQFYGDRGRYPDSLQELVDKRYLRAVPTDPLTESDSTWQAINVPPGYKGQVYDIRSGAPGLGRNGVPYGQW
jgi:general secretion pathway protein G